MKQHKWHKEIKAWADGAEIEYREARFPEHEWLIAPNPNWDMWEDEVEFRIKPQPKEPQYLYVYQSIAEESFGDITIKSKKRSPINGSFIGKIKLESEDETN